MKKRFITGLIALLTVVAALVAVNQTANAAVTMLRVGDSISNGTQHYTVSRVNYGGRKALAGGYCFTITPGVTSGAVWRIKRNNQRVYRCPLEDGGKGW